MPVCVRKADFSYHGNYPVHCVGPIDDPSFVAALGSGVHLRRVQSIIDKHPILAAAIDVIGDAKPDPRHQGMYGFSRCIDGKIWIAFVDRAHAFAFKRRLNNFG